MDIKLVFKGFEKKRIDYTIYLGNLTIFIQKKAQFDNYPEFYYSLKNLILQKN